MASRAADWLGQAERDLRAAEASMEAGLFEWACFIAQQAAQKAVKAVAQAHGGDVMGHAVSRLVAEVFGQAPDEIAEPARRLDKFYIPTRYPNGWAAGKPGDYYSREDAEAAIADAQRVVGYCQGHLA
jgi:HEPN domain-containing protein